jgi:ankyrin repeat protein
MVEWKHAHRISRGTQEAAMDEVDTFFDACLEDHLEVVRQRLAIDDSLIHARRIGGRTPLHQAAFGGALRVVELLIASGADINARTEYGWVPLHYAAAPESVSVAECLIAGGALLDVANDAGHTPLHLAADFGKAKMIERLLTSGANPLIKDGDGRLPLDYAAPRSACRRLLKAVSQAAAPRPVKKAKVPLIAHAVAKAPAWLPHSDLLDELLGKVGEQWNVAAKRGKRKP